MLKSQLMVLAAAACVTGVCSAGISGSGKAATPTPDGISGGGRTDSIKPACLIQINAPFIQPFCFV